MRAVCKVVTEKHKTRFALLTGRCVCAQIADFGMARMLSADDSYVSTETLGSLPYLAREVLQLNKGRAETARLRSEAAALEQRLADGHCIDLATTAADAAAAQDALAAAEAAAAADAAAARDALALSGAAAAGRAAEVEALSSRLAAADAREAARQEELAQTKAQLAGARERLAAAEAARADVGLRSLLQAQTALLEAKGRLSEHAAELDRLRAQMAAANGDAELFQAQLEAAEGRVSGTTTEENADPEGEAESAQDVEATAARVRNAARSATAQIAALRTDLGYTTSERDRAAAAAAWRPTRGRRWRAPKQRRPRRRMRSTGNERRRSSGCARGEKIQKSWRPRWKGAGCCCGSCRRRAAELKAAVEAAHKEREEVRGRLLDADKALSQARAESARRCSQNRTLLGKLAAAQERAKKVEEVAESSKQHIAELDAQLAQLQDTVKRLQHNCKLQESHIPAHALQMLEAAEGSLVEARRAAVATAERGDRLSAERDAAMRQVAALQAALAGLEAREAALSWTAQQLQHSAAQREDPRGTAEGPGEICGGDHADCSSCAAKAERISELR
ncbi:hypothetical protein COCSUDRAFT_68323 [Coccomyxa subellipsoidea C-169]|uniref:Protein kinase domain-containing protein n=1 Tax=Coccomyxa subellipsoidea (strain C-169) TaxID=574566 RepID=I0YJ24_COCSC|nr:hypothetical protein COCSUDRAFT_68323 [Coccomyxa subellipsoidea C-169]EIE18393.1 hypothetical protein COCSUDRAFT_68323 [Coccomyxa subellipsoidea C-169]|eukprot:XP_005642937.1 hypothetical protein COCSUDRAFT_68323 [Coccomyxa subellipsoidea C-169]